MEIPSRLSEKAQTYHIVQNHPWLYSHISHRSRPPLIQENTDYNLRNANDIRILRANTNLHVNSVLPSTIRAWTSLPRRNKASYIRYIF